MMKILTDRGYLFDATAGREIVRDMMETLCYVAIDFDSEMKSSSESRDEERAYLLPDGNFATVWAANGSAVLRFFVNEALWARRPAASTTTFGFM